MLDPWIIEEIRRREEEQRQDEEARQPRLEIQIETPSAPRDQVGRGERGRPVPGTERGVTIVDYTV